MAAPRYLAKRASLRRRSIGETPIPPTEGPHGGADLASLIFTGVPVGTLAKGAAFAPRGFRTVLTRYKPSRDFLEALARKVPKLKPVIELGEKALRRKP